MKQLDLRAFILRRPWGYRLAWLVVAAAYVLTANFGWAFADLQLHVSAVWPATGLALATLALLGYRMWPAVFVGALIANTLADQPTGVALAIAAGNTGEALLGIYLTRRWGGWSAPLTTVRSFLAYSAGAGVLATTLAATVGVAALTVGGLSAPELVFNAWFTWWLGGAVGALVVAPLLLMWLQPRREVRRLNPAQRAEAAGLTLLTVLVTLAIFAGWLAERLEHAPLPFLVLPFFMWAAMRFDPRDCTMLIILVTAVIITGTAYGHGPFVALGSHEGLLALQAFVAVTAFTTLILAITQQERSAALHELRIVQNNLEKRVRERTRDLEESKRALEEAEEKWRTATANSPDHMILLDLEGTILFINRTLPGFTTESVVGSSVYQYTARASHPAMGECFQRVIHSGRADGFEIESQAAGETRHYETRVAPVRRGGKIVALALSARDVTAHRRALAEIKRLHHHVSTLLEATGEGVFGVDTALRCTFVNRAAANLLGYRAEDMLGKDMHELIHNRTEDGSPLPRTTCSIHRTVAEQRSFLVDEDVLWTRNGDVIPVQYSSNPLVVDGQVTGAVVIFRNIAEARAIARKMDYLATHDPLTGLVNRREFEQRVRRELDATRTQGSTHVVCYLDLDQFKVVNDTCGHAAGDELLRQLTMLLHQKVRQGDTLARLGGDEFGVLATHCSLQDGLRVADDLRRVVRDFRFVWEDKTFTLGVSVGVAVIDGNTVSVGNVLTEADTACYMAKDAGRNRVHVYQADDAAIAKRRGEMQWVSRIHEALENGRFCLHAQPIVAVIAASRGAAAPERRFEVLVRMLDPIEGEVPPGAFIPAAERYNLMTAVDRWVVSKTLHWLAAHRLDCEDVVSWTINLSAQSLNDSAFLEFVQNELRDSAVAPARICFEITETAAVANLQSAVRFMCALKQLGCTFALDDFGSGMSSLAYLKTLPVDYLKIDGNFVRDIVDDPVDRAMIEAVNSIATVMGLRTVAEFVENDAILQKLRKIGVDFAQGFAVGHPLPLDQVLGPHQAAVDTPVARRSLG